MLLPFPFSEKGETSVRDSAVDTSDVVDDVDCEDCERWTSCPSCMTSWTSHVEGHVNLLGGLIEMITQESKPFLERHLNVVVPTSRIETGCSGSIQIIKRWWSNIYSTSSLQFRFFLLYVKSVESSGECLMKPVMGGVSIWWLSVSPRTKARHSPI